MTITARGFCFVVAFLCFVITAILTLAKSTAIAPLIFVWVGIAFGFLGLAFNEGTVIGGPRRTA